MKTITPSIFTEYNSRWWVYFQVTLNYTHILRFALLIVSDFVQIHLEFQSIKLLFLSGWVEIVRNLLL